MASLRGDRSPRARQLRREHGHERRRISSLPGLEADNRLYYRDLDDSLVRVSELVDSYRDLLSGATDMYVSTGSSGRTSRF